MTTRDGLSRRTTVARVWLIVAVTFATSAEAQDRPPSDPKVDRLVTDTRNALEELTGLLARAQADRGAFRRSEADLRQAVAEFRKPLSARPCSFG